MYKLVPFLLSLLVLLISNKEGEAQAPQKFNYQGIARDAQGNPMSIQSLSLKIAVLSTQDATVSDYEETQSATTNEFGLYTIQIGNGTPTALFTSDGMSKVKWETGNKYIRVAIDPNGGNDYTVLGTTQLLSVPYALYADKAGQARESVSSSGNNRAGNVSTSAAGTGATNYLAKFTAPNTIYNSILFDNGSAIGLGTTSPASRFHISTSNATQEHLRMENLNPNGWGKFIMYNDNPANYHTFSKYGSTYAGNYGPNTLFPYANLLAFGSNNSPTVMANGHNIGFATVSGANVTYKFIGVQTTGRVGLAGNSIPVADVHINRTDRTGDTLKITNNVTGHTTTDGLDIRTAGSDASIVNRENSILTFGTNNTERVRITASGDVGIGTPTPGAKLEVAGQVKITGGGPSAGKVLVSDANGLASWGTPSSISTIVAGPGIAITGNTISNIGDTSSSNELQTLSLSGPILSLSNGGGTVLLPTGTTYTPGAGINITGDTISNNGDLSTTNELQTISLNGTTLSLSNSGGSVTLPAGTTYTGGTGITVSGSTINNTGDLSAINELQTISLAGNTLSLSNSGGSVTLPAATTYTAGTGITISGTTINNTGDLSNTNELQTISLAGNTVSLSNSGGSFTLPGVNTLNGMSGTVTNSFTLGSAGTTPAISGSGTNAVTLNLPTANATNTGVLSSANWTTFNNKLSVAGGINNFIPKFTPNGSSIGNSLLKDSVGLMYNSTTQSNSTNAVNSLTDFTFRGSRVAFIVNKSSAVENQFILMNPNRNLILMGDSSEMQSGTTLYDSVGSIIFSKQSNNMHIGTPVRGLNIHTPSGKIYNGAYDSTLFAQAQLNIRTDYDTAGYFTSSSTNWLLDGILRAEYKGPITSNDQIGIVGRSYPDPNSNNGIGIQGEGGYRGMVALSQLNSSNENTGLVARAENNGNNIGISALASSFISPGGDKVGVIGQAGDGDNNSGVMGITDGLQTGNGWGGYFLGKQTGVYGKADSSSAGQTDYFGLSSSYREAIGVYGVGAMTNSVGALMVNEGVAGSSNQPVNNINIGVFGEAKNATYNYGIYGFAPGGLNNRAGYFLGDVTVTGNLSKAGGTFKIDHPIDPENKYLVHSFVESPDMMNVYNGNIITDANGEALVSLPSYFQAENKDFKYQLTVIDNSNDFVMAKVTKKVANNSFSIKTSKPNVEVSWQVTGVRQDAWANANRVVAEVDKAAEDKGYYLHPTLFGKPETQMVGPVKGKASEGSSAIDYTRGVREKMRKSIEDMKVRKARNEASLKNRKEVKLENRKVNPNNKGTIGG